ISRTGGFGFRILAKGFSVGQPFAFRTNPKRHRLLSASQAARLRHAHLLVVGGERALEICEVCSARSRPCTVVKHYEHYRKAQMICHVSPQRCSAYLSRNVALTPVDKIV